MKTKLIKRLKARFRLGILFFSLSLTLVSLGAVADDPISRASAAMKAKNYSQAVVELEAALRQENVSEHSEAWAKSNLGWWFLSGEREEQGVPAQPAKGYRLLLDSARLGNPWAAGKLGQAFFDGIGLPKNPAAARNWYRIAGELADEKSEEYRGKNQWIAKNKKWAESSAAIDDAQRFQKARQKWLQTKPAHERPFGVVFGYDYPYELGFYWRFGKFLGGVMDYRDVDVTEPFANGEHDNDASLNGYSVLATTKSAKVFQVAAGLGQFASEKDCMNQLSDYVIEMSEGADLRELGSCEGSNCGNWTSWWRVWQINGPADPLVDLRQPFRVNFTEDMVGTRVKAQCYDDIGKITVLHLPTLQLQRAEFLDLMSDRNLDWFKKTEAGKSHASLSPFGIRLVTPIANSVRNFIPMDWAGEADVASEIWASVTPPQKRAPFQEYTVRLSPLTETVLGVTGRAEFDSLQDCRVTMEATAEEIFNNHYQGSVDVWDTKITPGGMLKTLSDKARKEVFRVSPFYVTWNKLSTELGDFSHTDRSVVEVEVRCDAGPYTDLREKYGYERARNMWQLNVAFSYPWEGKIRHQEACLLDPIRSDCYFGY